MFGEQGGEAEQGEGGRGEREGQRVGQPPHAEVHGGEQHADGREQQPDRQLGPGAGGDGEDGTDERGEGGEEDTGGGVGGVGGDGGVGPRVRGGG
ncbi:hypothetical protein GCM10017687_13840 [Streptomyces echinatus]